jgi:hypothetical protein
MSHTQKRLYVSIAGAVSSHQPIMFVITTHALFAVIQSSLCYKTQSEVGVYSATKGAIG